MKKVELKLTSNLSEPLLVVLEPWGHELTLHGESLLIRFQSKTEGEPEVVFDEGQVTVWGWWGCELRLELDGQVLEGFSKVASLAPTQD